MTKREAMPPILRDLPDELCGERVVLRPFRAGDGAALWEATEESRDHIRPWLPWGEETRAPADSEAYARRSLARWMSREELPLGIWERTTGRFLGGTGLHRIRWEIPAFEIGYWLRRSAVGQGYMTETVRVLCHFAFEGLSANRVEIRVDARNDRSAAVPRRLGFVHEATVRNESIGAEGELRDMLLFGMIPEDYCRAFGA
jgi:RimJ/RimL family protein N-acetyltransferase